MRHFRFVSQHLSMPDTSSWYYESAVGKAGGYRNGVDRIAQRTDSAICYSVPGKCVMKYSVLDTVVLSRDLQEYGLCIGDLGATVGVYDPDGVEVEFVTASGKTEVVLTVTEHKARPVDQNDLIAVRPRS